MSPPEDLYPPPTHGGIWTAVGVGLVALVAGWWVVLWWRTRSRRETTPVWRPLRGRSLAARRASGIAAIDEVLRAYEAGETSSRAAFQRLSPLVREFAFDVAGVPAHTMTLADLQREQPGALAEVVALMYPAEFAAEVDGDVRLGAARAREVLSRWTPHAMPATTATRTGP